MSSANFNLPEDEERQGPSEPGNMPTEAAPDLAVELAEAKSEVAQLKKAGFKMEVSSDFVARDG